MRRWWTASYSAPVRWATRRMTSSVSRRGSPPRGISVPANRSQSRNILRLRPIVVNRFGGAVVPATRAAIRTSSALSGPSSSRPAGPIRGAGRRSFIGSAARAGRGTTRSACRSPASGRSRRCGSRRGGRRRRRPRPRPPPARWPKRSAPGGGSRGRRRSRSRSPRSGTTTSSASAAASRRASESRPRWRDEQVGWTTAVPTRSPISRLGEQVAAPTRSSRGSSSAARRSAFASLEQRRRLDQPVGARGRVDDDRQLALVATSARARSTVCVRHPLGAAAIALRDPGRAAAAAGDVGGDPDRACRPAARPRRAPRAATAAAERGRRRARAGAAEDPVHAGRQVDGGRAGADRRRHRRLGGAGGIGGSHSGTSSALTARRGRRR